jgi:serine/threonine protein kinase
MLNRESQRIAERIGELFDAASELPPEERTAFLDSNLHPLDEENQAIRQELDRLLFHHDSSGLLDRPGFGPAREHGPLAATFEADEVISERFRVIRMIGSGGMGEVYEVEDLALGQALALKTVRADIATDAHESERFRREIRICRTLAHRNICKVFDYEEVDRGPRGRVRFFTMELLRGETLAERLAAVKRMSPDDALAILHQVAAGIEEAHRNGIIHRDLKPSNIFLAREPGGSERAVVMDFGIALDVAGEDLRQTRTGMLMGTRLYVAPELPQTAGAFNDVYSFGVVALEMVTGSPSPLVAPRSIVPALDAAWDKALLTCFQLDPAKRPRSTLEVVALVERRTRRRWWPRAISSLGAAASITTALALWYQIGGSAVSPASDSIPITSDVGMTTDPASSADGKLLAYTSDRDSPAGDLNIWLQNMETGEARQITNDPANEDEPNLSPDGKLIAWHSSVNDRILMRPVAGGDSRVLAQHGHIPRFSPDGRYIAWWEGVEAEPNIRASIWILPVAPRQGEKPRNLAPDFADARLPSWTPDGKYVLFRGSRAASPSIEASQDWWISSLDGSSIRPTGVGRRLRTAGLEAHESPVLWHGSEAIFAASRSEIANLWSIRLIPFSGFAFGFGAPRSVTTSANFQDIPAILAGGRIAYTEWHEQVHIYRIDLSSGELKQVTRRPTYDTRVSASTDGRTLVFTRFHSRGRDVWVKDLNNPDDLKNERLVSSGDGKRMAVPFASPDGRTAAVSSGTSIRLIDLGGSRGSELCSHCGEALGWMPGNREILYLENGTNSRTIRLLDVMNKSERTLLSAPGLTEGAVSPDGQTAAFTIHGDSVNSQILVARLGTNSVSREWIPITPREGWADKPVWSPEGNTLYYSSKRDGFLCIWKQELDPSRLLKIGDPRILRHFHKATQSLWELSPSSFNLALGRDSLFVSVDEMQSNIWAVRR